jgi:hypothetical protein
MNILWLFDSCGYIFGPAILSAGLLALGLCLWANLAQRAERLNRIAAVFSLGPVVLGLCGALFGLGLLWYLGKLGDIRADNWVALGKVCLAGLVVTIPPLLWSLLLLRGRRGMA